LSVELWAATGFVDKAVPSKATTNTGRIEFPLISC
jgi:hypothetical protein